MIFSVEINLLLKFIPTAFLVSFLPGMCMTLALALGISVGFRKTLWMMIGELVAVGMICLIAVFSGTYLISEFTQWFYWIKWAGATYLIYLGIGLWFSRGSLAIPTDGDLKKVSVRKWPMIVKGFVIAMSNPKGWLLLIAIFPPFINPNEEVLSQGIFLITIFLLIEFICLCLYTLGGKTLRVLLLKPKNIILINRISGVLISLVGVWLILE